MQNVLLDSEFLKKLDLNQNKTIYARITVLTKEEFPLETIQGRITGGSISCNGDSNIRRTCSITMVEKDLKLTDIYWALRNKFKIEIGVLNLINTVDYEEIIWFKQGTYVINSFSKSHSSSGVQISISGQDKMCLLNGSLGGALPFEIDFGTYEIEEQGTIIKKKVLIKDIIKEALITYAKENENNIIINDLDGVDGWELWNYRGNTPLYLYYKVLKDSKGIVQGLKLYNLSMDNTKTIKRSGTMKTYIISNLPEQAFYSINNITNSNNLGWVFQNTIGNNKDEFVIMKIEYGEDAGYHKTELTYAGDLILQAGEPLTKLLDNIVQQLGTYEYFYDINGKFIFQKKKFYTQGIFSPVTTNNLKAVPQLISPNYSYEFKDSVLITSYSNSPNPTNIKNSFSIWGKKKGLSGNEISIHARFAIQKKPTIYTSLYNNKKYSTTGINRVDWRELIYQMALDYNRYKNNSNYAEQLALKNPIYYGGKTGYEQYYVDMLGFWRSIYDGYKFIINNPNDLPFWLDFIEPYGVLENYDIDLINERIKVENSSSVKAMWYEEIPEIEFLLSNEKDNYTNSYQGIQLPKQYEKYFSISSRGVSIFDKADELLNKHILNANSISLTSIPIYYLEPNSKIYVEDKESNIEGDYILSSFTLPLTYNGTMSITAKKIIKDFIV